MSQEQQGNTEAVEVKPSANQDGFPNTPEVGDDSDFTRDIQAIAAEQGLAIGSGDTEMPMPESEPEQTEEPSQPQDEKGSAPEADETQEESKPEVPEKFQKEDGSVDAERVEKSLLSAEEALAKYKAIERELRQTQSSVSKLKQSDTAPVQQSQPSLNAPQEASLDAIAKQIEDEIKLNGTGVALAKLMNVVNETAYQRARNDIMGIESEISSQKEAGELKRIAEQDDWVLSEKGFETLSKVRQENPWLENSPSPWRSALELAKGRGLAPSSSKTQSGSGKPNPTPKAGLVTPASGTRTAKPQVKAPLSLSKAELAKKLDKMTQAEEDEFWRTQGVNVWRT
jgi:hypothetical protein